MSNSFYSLGKRGENIWQKVFKKTSKIRQDKKDLISTFTSFLTKTNKYYFHHGRLGTSHVPTQFSDFRDISLFTKILDLSCSATHESSRMQSLLYQMSTHF